MSSASRSGLPPSPWGGGGVRDHSHHNPNRFMGGSDISCMANITNERLPRLHDWCTFQLDSRPACHRSRDLRTMVWVAYRSNPMYD